MSMEPVAPANDRQIELMKDFWSYYGSPPHKREFDARLLKRDFLSLIARAEAAEALLKEIAESDDIENALDPERNKRLAIRALKEKP